jgi:hypothetical protein
MASVQVPSDVAAQQLVHLQFRPMWKYIQGIRQFCDSFAATSFDDPELGHRVGLVIHELTENAIKYNRKDDQASLGITLRRLGNIVEVEVANTPEPEAVEGLRAKFSGLQSLPAREAYMAAMRRATTLPQGKSGLGLARVRHDGGMELALNIEQDVVRITARGTI